MCISHSFISSESCLRATSSNSLLPLLHDWPIPFLLFTLSSHWPASILNTHHIKYESYILQPFPCLFPLLKNLHIIQFHHASTLCCIAHAHSHLTNVSQLPARLIPPNQHTPPMNVLLLTQEAKPNIHSPYHSYIAFLSFFATNQPASHAIWNAHEPNLDHPSPLRVRAPFHNSWSSIGWEKSVQCFPSKEPFPSFPHPWSPKSYIPYVFIRFGMST